MNKISREINHRPGFDVIISDLICIKVNNRLYHVCLILDLRNREIIGFSTGPHKTAELVYRAFASAIHGLSRINIFYTDHGNDFKGNAIERLLETFNVERLLSKKDCPYYKAVAEATFKSFKTQIIWLCELV